MTPTDCPVAAKARDFAQTVALIHKLDEEGLRLRGKPGPEFSRNFEADLEAWGRLLDLQDEALSLQAASFDGLALQFTLAIDEVSQIENCETLSGQGEARLGRLRKVLMSALQLLAPRAQVDPLLVETFLGNAAAEAFRHVGPKPS